MIEHSEHNEELIESRVEAHDKQQFEVKLDYSINSSSKDNRYRIEAYFFVPLSLGIREDSYPKELFFRDVMGYIRFKTPAISFAGLLEPELKQSPFYRIRRKLASVRGGRKPKKVVQYLEHELKILGCTVRANLRDRIREGLEQLETCAEPDVARLQADLLASLRPVEDVLSHYRHLEFGEDGLGKALEGTYRWVDEFLSVTLENYLTILLERISQSPDIEMLEPLADWAALRLEEERGYRDKLGYPRIISEGLPNETYLYRRGLLKKLAMSVLFLKVNTEADSNRLSDFFASVAAGIAMLFAAFATIYSQRWWGLNTTPFVVALVVSYILKDRIKEWIRRYSATFVSRQMWDRSVWIEDPSNELRVGRCRERFDFLQPDSISDEVLSLRHRGRPNSTEALSKHESCFRYVKEVTLDGKRIGKQHMRLSDINDILRFSVSHLLLRADDPLQSVRFYHVRRKEVRRVDCPKVYHLNLVLKLRSGRNFEEETMERVRVVLDAGGIRGLRFVPA